MLSSLEVRTKKLGEIFYKMFLGQEVLNQNIYGIEIDSRKIREGDLFIALNGDKTEGRKYLDEAINNGAKIVIEESDVDKVRKLGSVIIIQSKGIRKEASEVASRFYDEPSKGLNVIAITGTNGKSTCVSLLSQLLNLLNIRCGSIGTLGYGFEGETFIPTGMTTPDMVECQKIIFELKQQGAKAIAIEASSHGLSQNRLASVFVDESIFTNLTRDHLDYHDNFEEYKNAKFSLFNKKPRPISIINIDDAAGKQLIEYINIDSGVGKVNLLSYSLNDMNADIYAKNIKYYPTGLSADLVTPWGTGNLYLNIIGDFNIYNALAVVASACELGCEFNDVLSALPKLRGARGRVEPVSVEQDNISVYVDYAHTPDALQKAILAVKKHVQKNVWVVFGCGGDRDTGKRSLMGEVAVTYADKVVITSDNPRTEKPEKILEQIQQGIKNKENIVSIENRKEAIEYALLNAALDDCVLIAGKGHEDYQEINSEKLPFSDFDMAYRALKRRYELTIGSLQ